jgi:hypothetical protein
MSIDSSSIVIFREELHVLHNVNVDDSTSIKYIDHAETRCLVLLRMIIIMPQSVTFVVLAPINSSS